MNTMLYLFFVARPSKLINTWKALALRYIVLGMRHPKCDYTKNSFSRIMEKKMNTRTHNKLATEIEREWNEPKPKQCHDAKQAKKHCNAEIYQKISRSLFRFTAFSSSSEKRGSSRKELWDEQYSIHLLVMLLYTVAFFIVGFVHRLHILTQNSAPSSSNM